LANLVDLPDPAREARVGAAGWKALFGAEPELPDGARTELAAWAERMADLLSPSLADHLLAPAQSRFGPLLGAERIAKGQLYSRFLLQRQLGAVRMLRDAGIRFVCLKGFALAHLLYPRPELRIVGDVDLLLDRAELRKATAALAAAGFKAMPIPNRFGFISDSSFLPLVSEDGQVALDLHLAPDAWPAGRALTAEAVFARAARFRAGDLELLGPAPEHAFSFSSPTRPRIVSDLKACASSWMRRCFCARARGWTGRSFASWQSAAAMPAACRPSIVCSICWDCSAPFRGGVCAA
jgi:hypothetical protein